MATQVTGAFCCGKTQTGRSCQKCGRTFDGATPAPGVKHDQQKRRFSLFPTQSLYAVVDVLEYGARKYAEGNWRNVENARQRYYDASMRHINDWWMGQSHDEESGHHHLAHAMCCLVFLLTVDLEQEQ